jgi:hypothetical protein
MKNCKQSKVDPRITWEPGTTGMALLTIAAMYVELADQFLGQGDFPGIAKNRAFAQEIGYMAIGKSRFQKLVKAQGAS